jgi:hypothetical protein
MTPLPCMALKVDHLQVFTDMFSIFDPKQETKKLLRGDFASSWRAYIDGEAEYAWRMLNRPETVAKLKAVMDRLGGKGGGKKAVNKDDSQARSKM